MKQLHIQIQLNPGYDKHTPEHVEQAFKLARDNVAKMETGVPLIRALPNEEGNIYVTLNNG